MNGGIWVTGCGLLTALGAGVEATWARLVRGERAIGPIELFDTKDFRSRIGAPVRAPLEEDDHPSYSRTTAMALGAAREALDAAGLASGFGDARAGLVVGGTVGGMFETEALLARFYAEPGSREVLSRMLSHPLTATADRLEAQFGPFARARTLSSACSGGANALVVAATWLLSGDIDVVLAGASDALCRLTFSGFNALAALDPEPCRPFDVRRRGLSLGEGAGFVVIERAERARARGAVPVVELRGWAIGSEAHHITNPESTGATPARLLRTAIARAGLVPEQIGYVNAHGTGTPLNDPMESRAIRDALGEVASRVPVSSVKGQMGHTLGAAGAIEAVITALAITRKLVPPTGGLEQPDPSCALAHVIGQAQRHDVRAAVSSSFGFGGMDAVLVMAEPGLAPARDVSTTSRSVVVTGTAVVTGADVDEGGTLDPARARRLDRAARMGTLAATRALARAGGALSSGRVGIVLGSPFGSVDGSSAYMHRLFTKGPRLASPAEFPNLVPSSPVGHASIYLGLRGPVLAVADLAASGEAAIAAAHELLVAGEADQIVAGAVEETSDIVERVFVALFTSHRAGRGSRSEGGGALVLEAEDVARGRGAKILARVERVLQSRRNEVCGLRAPKDPRRARVVTHANDGSVASLLAGTPWADCAVVGVAETAGDHEVLGANAASAAAEMVERGETDEALVVCGERGRFYAILLVRP